MSYNKQNTAVHCKRNEFLRMNPTFIVEFNLEFVTIFDQSKTCVEILDFGVLERSHPFLREA